jgi:hypothetical protein
MTALEERVHLLESRVATLADALRLLAHGLEGGPMSGPAGQPVADAARKAYDLLLAAEVGPARRRQRLYRVLRTGGWHRAQRPGAARPAALAADRADSSVDRPRRRPKVGWHPSPSHRASIAPENHRAGRTGARPWQQAVNRSLLGRLALSGQHDRWRS